jgi:predicted nucleotidyltransferase
VKKDALDLLREFIDRDVRFLIVGAHAVSFHAEPRTTGDLDLLIDPTPENAQATYAALEAFGAPLLDLTVADLCTPGMVYQMGVPPYRIDVLTEVTGVSFEEAWKEHELAKIEGLEVPVIGYDALVKNKKAIGRPKDAEDLRLLARHRNRDS